ncbi:Serine/threonine-protein kinase receptor, partial [Meloidogyne graminicola]
MDIHSMKSISSNKFIANFLGGFHWNKRCWLLIEYYEYGSLFDYLKENTISIDISIKMISTMLNGLAFLHEEIVFGSNAKPTIVHRDIKSKNILVRNDLNTCITDFGLALKCDSSAKNGGISAEQNILQVGTRRYMSPEVLEGATEFTSFAFQQIDVYAAALVIWEILSRTCILNKNNEELNENKKDLLNEDFSTQLFLLPYEKELGNNPSIGQIRDLVVNKKFRPKIRDDLLKNSLTYLIVKTMKEMWDHEPDGRITSACARDRSILWLS